MSNIYINNMNTLFFSTKDEIANINNTINTILNFILSYTKDCSNHNIKAAFETIKLKPVQINN